MPWDSEESDSEMTIQMTEERFRTVRLHTGGVSHLLDTRAPLYPNIEGDRQPSICNYRPIWPVIWIDDLTLPLCKKCETLREAESSEPTF